MVRRTAGPDHRAATESQHLWYKGTLLREEQRREHREEEKEADASSLKRRHLVHGFARAGAMPQRIDHLGFHRLADQRMIE